MRVLILTLIAFTIVPTIGNAQTARREMGAVSPGRSGAEPRMHAATGPTIQAAAIGIRHAEAISVSSESKAKRRSGGSQDVALMAVGVGAMVAGSFIHGTAGTIFLVGGAVVALYGLFNFLQ